MRLAASARFSSLSLAANALARSAASIFSIWAGVRSNSAGNGSPQKPHSLFLRLRIARLQAGQWYAILASWLTVEPKSIALLTRSLTNYGTNFQWQ